MKTIHDQNEDDLKEFPILQSLRARPLPEVPSGYFDNLTERVLQKVPAQKPQGKIIERNRWLGVVSLVTLAAAAAVLMLVMVKNTVPEAFDEEKMFSQISKEEMMQGIEMQDVDIEMIARTMGNEAMVPAETVFGPSLLDSLTEEKNLDFLRDIDPSEIYDL